MKTRLDLEMARRKLVISRSQAESWIKLGKVSVDGNVVIKPGFFVSSTSDIKLQTDERYVSRAGLKLASVTQVLKIEFSGTTVLDVGSSTGGFTDYALQHGAAKVYAVDVGTDQLHPTLQKNSKIELHEKTDIRHFTPATVPDIILIDVSFISLRDILPHIYSICSKKTQVIAMVKPQFEAGLQQVARGVIKNDTIRRTILKEFETWAKQQYLILGKADSDIAGSTGNRERFYKLQRI